MTTQSAAKKPLSIWLPVLLGAAALLPFLVQYRHFKELFWFGDEFPLIDEIDTMPFAHWVWSPFAENILPLFKLLWGGAVLKGGGAYIGMLWGAWAIHGLTVGLLAEWMRRRGFGWGGIVLAASLFGWSASQLETLTWSVQSSSELATLFFVCGALMLPAAADEDLGPGQMAGLLLFSTASAWSFARGLLTGPVLALALGVSPSRIPKGKKWLGAALCLLPTLITAMLMLKGAPENSRHLAGGLSHWASVLEFGFGYLAGSPALTYWYYGANGSGLDATVRLVATVGFIKLVVMITGWRLASRDQRGLLLPACLLELGYAVLLGLGRGEGDWRFALSSRYQYNSLLCTIPFAAVVLERVSDRIGLSLWTRRIPAAAAIVVLAAYSFFSWSQQLPGWAEWRGLESRQLLMGTGPVPSGSTMITLPTFPDARAKQLVDKYHLH